MEGTGVKVHGSTPFVHLAPHGLYVGIARRKHSMAHYGHFLYAFEDAPPFAVKHVGTEFCFATEPSAGMDTACEIIQFASGLALDDSEDDLIQVAALAGRAPSPVRAGVAHGIAKWGRRQRLGG